MMQNMRHDPATVGPVQEVEVMGGMGHIEGGVDS